MTSFSYDVTVLQTSFAIPAYYYFALCCVFGAVGYFRALQDAHRYALTFAIAVTGLPGYEGVLGHEGMLGPEGMPEYEGMPGHEGMLRYEGIPGYEGMPAGRKRVFFSKTGPIMRNLLKG